MEKIAARSSDGWGTEAAREGEKATCARQAARSALAATASMRVGKVKKEKGKKKIVSKCSLG